MVRAGIVGATGYAGAELVRIISGHPDMEVSAITSRQYAGMPFNEVFPAMDGVVESICESYSEESFCEKVDVVFTALPHKISMEIIPGIISRGKKVVDLSADFRFSDPARYESSYQPHTAKELLSSSVYGLTEVYKESIKKADLVGNPGCYPTSMLLPLIPIINAGFVDTDSIITDSKSGVSGAGRAISLTTHFCEVNESFKAYKVAEHRHIPEMEEVLSREARVPVAITFTPHLVPITRGMLTTTYATLSRDIDADSVLECLSDYYRGRYFVRICKGSRLPDTLRVRRTNYCDIGFRIDRPKRRLILISAIDNLVKGAAGQAVQNMNIMLGLSESRGLLAPPSVL